MACKIKLKSSSLEYDRNNTFVKSSFIANSASKGGGGGGDKKIHYSPFLPFCCCSFGTKKTCTVERKQISTNGTELSSWFLTVFHIKQYK